MAPRLLAPQPSVGTGKVCGSDSGRPPHVVGGSSWGRHPGLWVGPQCQDVAFKDRSGYKKEKVTAPCGSWCDQLPCLCVEDGRPGLCGRHQWWFVLQELFQGVLRPQVQSYAWEEPADLPRREGRVWGDSSVRHVYSTGQLRPLGPGSLLLLPFPQTACPSYIPPAPPAVLHLGSEDGPLSVWGDRQAHVGDAVPLP